MRISLSEYLTEYLEEDSKVHVKLSGFTDATKIVSDLRYNNEYGEFPQIGRSTGILNYYLDGRLTDITIRNNQKIDNPKLGFLRAYGIKNFIKNNVDELRTVNVSYSFSATTNNSSEGGDYRKVRIELIINYINLWVVY